MQIPKEYSIAYAEVLEIIKYLRPEERRKIPQEKIEYMKSLVGEEFGDIKESKHYSAAREVYNYFNINYWEKDSY